MRESTVGQSRSQVKFPELPRPVGVTHVHAEGCEALVILDNGAAYMLMQAPMDGAPLFWQRVDPVPGTRAAVEDRLRVEIGMEARR